MSATKTKPTADRELRQLGGKLVKVIGETLGSLLGRDLTTIPEELELTDGAGALPVPGGPQIAIRAAIDQDNPDRRFLLLFDAKDACAMAGCLLLASDDAIEQKRAVGALQGEDATAFGELANVLLSSFGNVLRDNQVTSELRLVDHGPLPPPNDAKDALPSGPLVVQRFRMRLANHPETTGCLIIDLVTGESWNKAPLPGATPATARKPGKGAGPASGRSADEESIDDIPQAPIRGTAAAFVLHADVLPLLRRACRRTGLELRKHGRAEIPNPAAHRNEIVVLDVPPGEERRFDWCRRIKEFNAEIKLVVLLHQPSRARVTQAFLSRADVILGLPCAESQLAQKLDGLLAQA